MLLHANSRWKEAANTHLLPHELRTAADAHNEAPTTKLQRSPLKAFSDSTVMTEPKCWRPFGCPVCALGSTLQQQGIKNKWSRRSKVGTCLGRSPLHTRSVALVLNLQTGRALPQHHTQFDPSFQTVKGAFGGNSPPSSWQRVCGFTNHKSKVSRNRDLSEFKPEINLLTVESELQEQNPLINQQGEPTDRQDEPSLPLNLAQNQRHLIL